MGTLKTPTKFKGRQSNLAAAHGLSRFTIKSHSIRAQEFMLQITVLTLAIIIFDHTSYMLPIWTLKDARQALSPVSLMGRQHTASSIRGSLKSAQISPNLHQKSFQIF